MIWRVPLDGVITLRKWDDELVAYNSSSGDTHLLGELATTVFLFLQKEPLTTEALVIAVATFYQINSTDEIAVQIGDILTDLHALALIEAA